jgi:hypothetical protein
MLITEKKSISQADYNKYKNESKEKVEEFVGWAAHFSGYHPAGYGMYNPRVEMVDKYHYYAVWERSDNCD